MSMYELRYGIAWTRSRMVAPVSRRTRRPSVPASGLASIARILSCRSVASVEPSAVVVVVLPTPPLRLMTAMR
ncbi:hypothetical protein RKD37_002975 [Streptomyces ambofaciens]